jgi:hypothetical protein
MPAEREPHLDLAFASADRVIASRRRSNPLITVFLDCFVGFASSQ